MLDKVRAFAEKYNMLPKGETVLAAVSGGADSMCLLSVLNVLSRDMGFNLEAVHYNHMLRGAESDRDEAFVREQCSAMGIPCHVGSGDVSLWAKNHGIGTEEAGRQMRYGYFYELAACIGAARIATAHTASDNCETVIMNITRGAGLGGMCGIPPCRGIIVRPLLTIDRCQVISYLTTQGISHVEDSSNSSDDYTRNRLRHSVIPVLKEINPSFADSITKMTASLRTDRDHLDAEARRFLDTNVKNGVLSVDALLSLPDTIATRAVRSFSGITMSQVQTESVLHLVKSTSPSGKVDLPGVTAFREYDSLYFSSDSSTGSGFAPFSVYDGFEQDIYPLGLHFSCKAEKCSEIIHKSFNSFVFKTDGLCGTITVRPRMTGDKLTIAGRGVTKTVKKLMIEEHVPQSRRSLIPVFCDEAGVIAVSGLGQDPKTVPAIGDTVLKVSFKNIK